MYIKEIKDGLMFDNGTKIEDYHEQDCYEQVYADWDYLKQYNINPQTGEAVLIYEIDFDDDIQNHIECEKDMGIKLVAKDGSKWFVPCYNVQNGYYDSTLYLDVYSPLPNKQKIVVDITESVKDVFD